MIPLVLAYKRTGLIKQLVARLLEIDSEYKRIYGKGAFSSIFLIHDGLRETEDKASQGFHQETRELCVDLELTNTKIQSIFYNANIGLTNHIFRVINNLGSDLNNYIFFEEDKAPTKEGIQFLIQTSKSMNPADLIDTLPFNRHESLRQKSICTLFTDNGNTIIGDELLEVAKNAWLDNYRYQEIFSKNLYEYLGSFLSGFALKRAHSFYLGHLQSGLTNVDRTDSLFAYSLIVLKRFKTCPSSRLSEDWSDQDNRGKNVNSLPIGRNLSCKSHIIEIWQQNVCAFCERQGINDRTALNPVRAIFNSIGYRASKFGK